MSRPPVKRGRMMAGAGPKRIDNPKLKSGEHHRTPSKAIGTKTQPGKAQGDKETQSHGDDVDAGQEIELHLAPDQRVIHRTKGQQEQIERQYAHEVRDFVRAKKHGQGLCHCHQDKTQAPPEQQGQTKGTGLMVFFKRGAADQECRSTKLSETGRHACNRHGHGEGAEICRRQQPRDDDGRDERYYETVIALESRENYSAPDGHVYFY
ncbi:MAG: hypothetical protein IPQ01_02585 [Zoogloea sp.]|nr:hypothetical protein [Zoogloea sp.]